MRANTLMWDKTSILKNVGLGSLAGVVAQGINLFGRLAIVPLFLWAWGAEEYGEWLILYAVVGYFSVLDLGMHMYVVNRLNQSYSSGRLKDYTRILHSALFLYLFIALMGILLVSAFVSTAPIGNWLSLKHIGNLAGKVIVLLLACQLIFNIPIGLIKGLYRTFGRYPLGVMLNNAQQFALYAFTALILLVHGSPIAVAMVQLVPLVGISFLVFSHLKRHHPEIQLGLREGDWHLAISFLRPGFFFFLIMMANALTLQGSTLVVNAFLGSIAVVTFVTFRTMANLVRQVVGLFNSAVWPIMTSLEAKREYSKLALFRRLQVKICLAVGISGAIALHFAGKNIAAFWLQGRLPFDQKLLDVFLLYVVFQVLWQSSSLILAASNRHRNMSLCYVISSVLGLGLSAILAPRMGTVGVVVGLWIADMLIPLWFLPWEACRMLQENLGGFWLDVLLRGAPVMVIQWLLSRQIVSLMDPGVLRIILICSGVATVSIVAGYFLWLNIFERTQIASAILKAWKTVKPKSNLS